MPFQSKSEQRAARSMDAVAADRIVTSTDKPELNRMPQDKNDLTGGSIGRKASGNGALTGGRSLKVGGTANPLYGPLGKDGGGTKTGNGSYRQDVRPGQANTTREKMGRTGQTFSAKTRKGG